MKVEFVNLKRQNKLYWKEFSSAISNVIKKADFIQGEELDSFEANFAKYCGVKYAIGLNSGTDALFFALLANNIGKGDEVITVVNSYFSSAMVISQTGAKPVFVDVRSDNFNMDIDLIERSITKHTKAIIPVHLCGQPVDMDPISKLAKKHNLIIIEDACQAHGAKYKGKRVPITGTGAFSFYPGKNLGSFGDGGALVTDNKGIAKKTLLLRNDGSILKYKHEQLGYKSRLDTLQAAVLDVKLKHLTNWNTKRRYAATLYKKLLSDVEQITLPQEMTYAYHVYHIYMIQAPNRNQLQKYLAKNGVATIIHYPTPIHLQKAYINLGYKEGDFPVAEKLAKNILSLPVFPEINPNEIEYISSKIRNFYTE